MKLGLTAGALTAALVVLGPEAVLGSPVETDHDVVYATPNQTDDSPVLRSLRAASQPTPVPPIESLQEVDAAERPVPVGVTRLEQSEVPPARVVIPPIGVDATLETLGLEATGAVMAPVNFDHAGWFSAGPAPGEPGPALIAGHIDSVTGPAVFARLGELTAGDPIDIVRVDGSVAPFEVVTVSQHPKADFPSHAVYGPVSGSALRLVTCGGAFDRASRHYLDNVIVYAEPR